MEKLLDILCVTPVLICIAVPAGIFGFMLLSVPERIEIKLLGIPFLIITLAVIGYGLFTISWLTPAYNSIVISWHWAILNWKQLSLACVGTIIASLIILFLAKGNSIALRYIFIDVLLVFAPSVLLASLSASISSFFGELINNYNTLAPPTFGWWNDTGIFIGAVVGGISLLISIVLNIKRSKFDENFFGGCSGVISVILSSVISGAVAGAMTGDFWGGAIGVFMGGLIGSVSIFRIYSDFGLW